MPSPPAPIALQLYTIREQIEADGFEPCVRRIAEMGYLAVETAGFPGTTPEAAAKLFTDLDLRVAAAHLPPPVGEERETVLETVEALGCTRIVSMFGAAEFETADKVAAVCDRWLEALEAAERANLELLYHNHWWEFEEVGGVRPYATMESRIGERLRWELDVYWSQTGGVPPAEALAAIGDRTPLLHIKDGSAIKDEPMTAVGAGTLDFHAIARAGAGRADFWIVELDRCAGDMMQAVQQSYDWLTSQGLAKGRA